MDNPVILTGLRANNDLHIGNYFGSLLPFTGMAREKSADYQLNLFVPDLHSFTTPIEHSELQAQILHNVKIFVAAGLPLDHDNINIYRQSYVSAHSELTWILDCFTSFGEMRRMTQFKDKSGKLHEDRISVGLFNYPVLMAADILLYGASYVPVGDDQTQHLEFARDIAERMNARFGELFVVPKPVKAQHEFFGNGQGLRVKDLMDPGKKMAKSDETGKGVIFMSENPESAAKKVMAAATDSFGEIQYQPEERPGVSNLLQMLSLLEKRPLQEVVDEWQGRQSYGELKKVLAETVRNFLREFQETLANVDETSLHTKLQQSETAINKQANATLFRVQQAVGLRPKSSHYE
jgi:tryptophanyl-tRNA synthetase